MLSVTLCGSIPLSDSSEDVSDTLYKIAIMAPPILFSIILHEIAHGWVANRLGDDTAKRAGRLTLNPISHIDPFGSIILPLLLAVSGSNVVLRRMLRRYTRAGYLEVAGRLREAMPGITLSTDIIVGFPGETDAQFEETLSLVTDADFDDAYTFKYSVREGTPAVRLGQHVPDEVASARLDRLIEHVRTNARRKNAARVGQVHEVLVERPARRGGLMLGRTRANHLVLLELPVEAAGEYRTCRLTGTTGSTFTGAVVTPALAVL